MGVNSWFSNFHKSIYMQSSVPEAVRRRYKAITKRINQEYWDSDSEIEHSLYVGSYGRGTAIYASDIDIIVRLPWSVKERFDKRVGNIQSQLLTEVKEKLTKTYSTSHLSSDGQVIVIEFTDGIRYEIVPSFEYSDGSFCYPDTNHGGTWRTMDPRKEMEYFNSRHSSKNYTMKKFCRMIRCWRESNDITMSGELLDSIIYDFYLMADYVKNDPYLYFDWITRDFFKYLMENVHKAWFTPGTYRLLYIKYPYITGSNAGEMYEKTLRAIEYEKDYPTLAKNKWREIYGDKF